MSKLAHHSISIVSNIIADLLSAITAIEFLEKQTKKHILAFVKYFCNALVWLCNVLASITVYALPDSVVHH